MDVLSLYAIVARVLTVCNEMWPNIVIAGANRGIGSATVKRLASEGTYSIVALCRSKERAMKTLASIPAVEVVDMDLESLY